VAHILAAGTVGIAGTEVGTAAGAGAGTGTELELELAPVLGLELGLERELVACKLLPLICCNEILKLVMKGRIAMRYF